MLAATLASRGDDALYFLDNVMIVPEACRRPVDLLTRPAVVTEATVALAADVAVVIVAGVVVILVVVLASATGSWQDKISTDCYWTVDMRLTNV